jgi:ATP-binding cassette, subfamily B, bacterial
MKPQPRSTNVMLFMLQCLKPFRIATLVLVTSAVIWAANMSVGPFLLKTIVDNIGSAQDDRTLSKILSPIMLYFFMMLSIIAMYRLYGYFANIKMIPEMRANITRNSFKALLKQHYSYHQNNFPGSLATKINDLSTSIPDSILIFFDFFLRYFLSLLLAFYMLYQINLIFAIVMISWVSLSIVGGLLIAKKVALQSDIMSQISATITGNIVDSFSNILSIRLFSACKHEISGLNKNLDAEVAAERKVHWTFFYIWLVYNISWLLLLGLNLYFLSYGWVDGSLTSGDFIAVLGINIAVGDFLWLLIENFANFSKFSGKAAQALRYIESQPKVQDKPNAKSLRIDQGSIVFEQVKFNYKGTEALFYNKSIIIKPGQKVGLVGYSGGGKTTFVNLILRLYDLSGGHIFIDNKDIVNCTQDSLRTNIAMIPQDPSLFHRSLIDNIRYGKINATNEEVIEAAKAAYAHRFITALPLGYDSLVGERGVKLSGGQRQRIAIARAILKNAPILILDEATSQLDSVTESHIQKSLWKLMQGKTTIVIAHRLSTLLHMDRILVFDQGKILEDGTHESLLKNNSLYKTLWDKQVGGFLPDKKSDDVVVNEGNDENIS